MAAKKKSRPHPRSRSSRVSVSLSSDLHQTLQDIASQKKVSVAWVVRDAAEKYVADQWPLFSTNQK
ncbi:MAG: ribbon-helix-helix protein, CopG family [Casimicrobiaceae bacterium]